MPTRTACTVFLLGAILAPATTPVLAQDVLVGDTNRRTTSPQRWYRGSSNRGGYGGWGGYNFSSTPVEGALRGQADVIRAAGEASESYTNALINYEEARSRYYDNKLKWAEIYWQRRRLNEAERQVDYDKQRARRDNYRNNRSRTVARLNPSQLDPSTGKIYWPTALQAPEFYSYRTKLDELLLTQAHSNHPGLSSEINRTSLAMKNELKTHIRDMTPNEYLEARKFIDGLTTEALIPAG